MTGYDRIKMNVLGRDFTKSPDVQRLCEMAVVYAHGRNMDEAVRMGHFPETYVFEKRRRHMKAVIGKPGAMLKMALKSVTYGQNIFIADGENYSGQRELMARVMVMARAIEATKDNEPPVASRSTQKTQDGKIVQLFVCGR